ncbi:MAG: hypothetical protein HYV04_18665 [Deltaproteobacteria bacterium]|nr:hypothetical protein [Deltaproteobacteria bacterium]
MPSLQSWPWRRSSPGTGGFLSEEFDPATEFAVDETIAWYVTMAISLDQRMPRYHRYPAAMLSYQALA